MIPAEAVEAAKLAIASDLGYQDDDWEPEVIAILEAAAPFLMAAAWDRAAASIIDEHGNPLVPTNVTNPYRE